MQFAWDNIVKRAGDLARPYVLYMNGTASTFAIVWVVLHPPEDWLGAAAFVTAVGGLVAALYGAKAVEETRKAGQAAEVEKVKAAAAPAPEVAAAPGLVQDRPPWLR